MQKRMRKRIFIDSKVQGALLRRCIIHWVVFGFAALGLLMPLHYMMGGPEGRLSVDLSSVWNHYKLLVVVLLVMLPVFLYDLVRLSHRFAGPITRLRNEMHRAALGEKVKPIHFREDDFWQELAEEFNALLDRIEKQVDSQNSNRDEVSGAKVVASPTCEPEVYDELNTSAVPNA